MKRIMRPSAMLLVANDGGHITQLAALAPRLPDIESTRVVWATVKTPQTESLLEGEEVLWLAPSDPRDWRVALKNAWASQAVFNNLDITLAVSTGSSLAVAVLPVAAARRVRAVYIESATRVCDPSFAGRLLHRLPGITTLTQQQHWRLRGWRYAGSIFDGYAAEARVEELPVRRVLVTLGTARKYGFRRLVSRLCEELPAGVEVRWQTGSTDVSGLGISGVDRVDAATLRSWVREADVVVSHAGTGSALVCLEEGKVPLLVPRDPAHGEHVDDHQQQIADDLSRRGLAVVRDADFISWADLTRTANLHVSRIPAPPLIWP